MIKLMGGTELNPSNQFTIMAGKALCQEEAVTQIVCENFMFLVVGYSTDQLNSVGKIEIKEFFEYLTCYPFISDNVTGSIGSCSCWCFS